MEEVKRRLGFVGSPRVFHWSPAEESAYATAYNSAKARHPDRAWPDSRLFDFLNLVVRKEPVVVRGALGFETPGRGRASGAMVGAWSAAAEARRGGLALGQVELMREIERYNEVDCRVMAEVIGYLRMHH